MINLRTSFLLAVIVPLTFAAPLLGIFKNKNKTPTTPLAVDDLQSKFLRAAQFTRVAYCSSGAVSSWECGTSCEVIGKGVKVIQAGGDDRLIPGYFVAHDPSTETIVVSHQGTNSKDLLSILNDAQLALKDISTKRFTSAKGKSIEIHDGFQKTFERTADEVLAAVKRGLAEFKSTKVHVTGHSLGGSIATLEALLLRQELDSSIEIETTVFGLPRVGNKEFADFVDEMLGNTFARISNQDDPVPRLPPRLIGYQHPSGEIHIKAVNGKGQATDVVNCEGQENESDGCSSGNDILNILKLDVPEHNGPYFDNISFSSLACPL
ncbi:hypothetical protein V5O48_008782 [Marasmius crinis-equi]|uniref:Fungal lipase-type domain-containing protein n=1 Tax=Marasmius crinis-equi TaxID=585013 RepID=A0ABR3FDF7_9AGAR